MPTKEIIQPGDEIPTVARITLVENIVKSEPAFKDRLGEDTVTVARRDGGTSTFYKTSFDISVIIHRAGLDAVKLGKTKILAYARDFFGLAPIPTVPMSPKTKTGVTASNQVARCSKAAVQTLIQHLVQLDRASTGGPEVAAELAKLSEEAGAPSQPLPTLVPYTLAVSASQFIAFDQTLAPLRAGLDKLLRLYQAKTVAP